MVNEMSFVPSVLDSRHELNVSVSVRSFHLFLPVPWKINCSVIRNEFRPPGKGKALSNLHSGYGGCHPGAKGNTEEQLLLDLLSKARDMSVVGKGMLRTGVHGVAAPYGGLSEPWMTGAIGSH